MPGCCWTLRKPGLDIRLPRLSPGGDGLSVRRQSEMTGCWSSIEGLAAEDGGEVARRGEQVGGLGRSAARRASIRKFLDFSIGFLFQTVGKEKQKNKIKKARCDWKEGDAMVLTLLLQTQLVPSRTVFTGEKPRLPPCVTISHLQILDSAPLVRPFHLESPFVTLLRFNWLYLSRFPVLIGQ